MGIRKEDYGSEIIVSDWLNSFRFNFGKITREEYDHDEQTYRTLDVDVSEWKEVVCVLVNQLVEQSIKISELNERVESLSGELKHFERRSEP